MNLNCIYLKKDIAIISGSQAAIKALGNCKIKSKLVREGRTKLDELGKRNKLTLRRVTGYFSIPDNEAAGTLESRSRGCTNEPRVVLAHR